MQAWQNFFFAELGAAAVLAGLIFVGVSINLSDILAVPKLPSRALEALALLLIAMVVTSLMLVPGQPVALVGWEILACGIAGLATTTVIDIGLWRAAEEPYRRASRWISTLNQFAVVSYLIAGVTVLVRGLDGLYWLVPAILISLVKALVDAWVLLVEIKR
jgi:hypothetical protein